MKSDIDIKDDIYNYLKGGSLVSSVTGELSKTVRPNNSSKEDIVISVLANNNGQMQSAYVNVNIYVPDIKRKLQNEEHTIRLRELCKLAEKELSVGRGDGYRFHLESQRVLEVNERAEHVINNKLMYRQNNE